MNRALPVVAESTQPVSQADMAFVADVARNIVAQRTALTDSADQYFVLHREDYCYERGRSDRSLERTVADIANGQFDRIGRVIRVNIADHSSFDATEDVAEAVRLHLLHDGRKASETIRNWIEDALGAHSADCVTDEMESA